MAQIAAREAVFAAIASRLAARLTGVAVERNRTDAVEPADCPLVVLTDGDQSVDGADAIAVGLVRYQIRVQMAGYVTGATLAASASAANDLHARAVASAICNSTALGAAVSPIVVGIAPFQTEVWIEELGTRFDRASVEESDAPFAAFVTDLSVRLDLPEGSPFLDI